MIKISVVIPCYFNELNLPETTGQLIGNENRFGPDVEFEYVLIDDGSEDDTWKEILQFKKKYPSRVTAVKLRENVGPYNAIYAGMQKTKGDCIVVMAADLQDPPDHIRTMFSHWQAGAKLVLANRLSTPNSKLNQLASNLFYSFVRATALPKLPQGGFDFCLFDNDLKHLLTDKMVSGTNSLYFLLLAEHKPVLAPYSKQARTVGNSRWTFVRKWRLMINTIFAFSSIHPAGIYLSPLLLAIPCLFISSAMDRGGIVWWLLILVCILCLGFGVILRRNHSQFRHMQEQAPFVIEEVI